MSPVLPREKLKQLIEKRIGKENFVEKLGFITKHELYSRAAQKPQPIFPSPEQMLFDHEFTKLVKELEGQWEAQRRLVTNSWLGLSFTFMLIVVIGMITKAVHKSSEEEKKEEEVKKTLEQHDNIVTQYKELIREQVNTAKNCLFLIVQARDARADHLILTVPSSGCSDPGVEGTVVVHDVSERTDAGHHDSAGVADPAAQGSVQHPQVEIRWAAPMHPM